MRRGGAAVEFALTLPVIVAILAAIVDLAEYISLAHRVERACRDGARVGSYTLDGSAPIGDDLEAAAIAQAHVALQATGLDDGASVSAEYYLDADGFHYLRVVVEHPFDARFGLFGLDDGVRAAFEVMPLQQG